MSELQWGPTTIDSISYISQYNQISKYKPRQLWTYESKSGYSISTHTHKHTHAKTCVRIRSVYEITNEQTNKSLGFLHNVRDCMLSLYYFQPSSFGEYTHTHTRNHEIHLYWNTVKSNVNVTGLCLAFNTPTVQL